MPSNKVKNIRKIVDDKKSFYISGPSHDNLREISSPGIGYMKNSLLALNGETPEVRLIRAYACFFYGLDIGRCP